MSLPVKNWDNCSFYSFRCDSFGIPCGHFLPRGSQSCQSKPYGVIQINCVRRFLQYNGVGSAWQASLHDRVEGLTKVVREGESSYLHIALQSERFLLLLAHVQSIKSIAQFASIPKWQCMYADVDLISTLAVDKTSLQVKLMEFFHFWLLYICIIVRLETQTECSNCQPFHMFHPLQY